MTDTTWTIQYGHESVYISAHASRSAPLAVLFRLQTGAPEYLRLHSTVVRREVGEDAASVWRRRSETIPSNEDLTFVEAYGRLDDAADAPDRLVPAVVELADTLTSTDLLAICRASAAEDVNTAINAVDKLVEAGDLGERLTNARDLLRRTTLVEKAVSLDTAAARDAAVAYVPDFTGSPDDLAMVVEAVTAHAVNQNANNGDRVEAP